MFKSRVLDRVKIKKGLWAYVDLDLQWPEKITVYSGAWEKRIPVGYITKHQAMAYYRHWNNGGIYYSVMTGNYKWKDIRLIGDIDAFYGTDEDGYKNVTQE